MTQKEKAIFVLQALIKTNEAVNADVLFEKLDACLELQRPEVLLSEKSMVVYEKLVEDARNKGKII